MHFSEDSALNFRGADVFGWRGGWPDALHCGFIERRFAGVGAVSDGQGFEIAAQPLHGFVDGVGLQKDELTRLGGVHRGLGGIVGAGHLDDFLASPARCHALAQQPHDLAGARPRR